MFSNCTSLETVLLSDFYYNGNNLNMSYIFYNCSSLVSLIFPYERMNLPYDMSYSFAYCSSLKKLELEFNDIVNETNTMSNAFRNCTSLISITLKFALCYEDISYLFMGCSSLESLTITYPIFPYPKYMNGMFMDCSSLMNIDFIEQGFYCDELIDIGYMFSGSSVMMVDFSKLWTKNIKNYRGLFYDCQNLSSIDLSSFTHNDLPDSNLSIFNDKSSCGTMVINEEFLKRIQVPPNFTIILFEEITDY